MAGSNLLRDAPPRAICNSLFPTSVDYTSARKKIGLDAEVAITEGTQQNPGSVTLIARTDRNMGVSKIRTRGASPTASGELP